MKKIYRTLAFSAAFVATLGVAQAQECLTGGCTPSASQYPPTTQSTTSSAFVPIATDMYGGEYAVCSVTSGTTYHWSLCASDGGNATYDSELTLFHGTTNAVLCYSDDACGDDAKIGWTATFTGTVKIQVNQWDCAANQVNTTLVWRTVPSGTDAGVNTVYTLGTISNTHSNPHVVSALVANGGTTTLTNLPVTLNVTGANTFTNVQTIGTLAPGASATVTFAGYNSTATGTNNVAVTVAATGDVNAANNTATVSQAVTSTSTSYAYGTTSAGGAGFNNAVGEVAAKFSTSVPATISQVKPIFNTAGGTYKVKIWNANGAAGAPGTLLYTSPTQTATVGVNTVNVTPGVAVTGSFFVGVEQVGTTNMALGYQLENPLRGQTFYFNSTIATPAWGDLSPTLAFRLMIETVFACPAPAAPSAITGSATVCAGQSVTYNVPAVTGATSYTWTLPTGWTGTSTTNSITTTAGAAGGNITVTANNSCAASTPATFAVTASAAPGQPNTITGPASVCQGATGTYTVPAVTGATGYVWTLPTGWTGTSTTNSITVTAGTTGGNISAAVTNSCGTGPAQTLAVQATAGAPAAPSAITGSAATCAGSSVTYTVPAVTGATSYTWTLPTGWTGTSATNSITTTAGTAGGTISVTAENGCGTSAATTLAVAVNSIAQPAAITGNLSVCDGSTATYTVPAVAGATSYTWTLPNGWSGTSTTNSITATAGATGGNITVTATDGTCTSPAQTLAVTASALPAVPTITNNGNVLASSAATGNQWSLNGAPIAGATAQFYTATANGIYTVTVTNAAGCSAVSALYNHVLVGLEEALAAGIKLSVYPNPATSQVTVSTSSANMAMQVELTNVIGVLVLKAVVPAGNGSLTLNTSSLSKGLYLITLTGEHGKVTSRLVIE